MRPLSTSSVAAGQRAVLVICCGLPAQRGRSGGRGAAQLPGAVPAVPGAAESGVGEGTVHSGGPERWSPPPPPLLPMSPPRPVSAHMQETAEGPVLRLRRSMTLLNRDRFRYLLVRVDISGAASSSFQIEPFVHAMREQYASAAENVSASHLCLQQVSASSSLQV